MSTPSVVERGEQHYVGATRAVTMEHFAPVADRIPELIGELAGRGIAVAGAPFLRYHVIDMENELVVEAGVPVDGPVDGVGDAGVLPAGRYAVLVHEGHPDDLIAATDALLTWADEHGHALDSVPGEHGDVWACRLETFLTNPMEVPDQNAWRTEIAILLA
jgi:effector-binding domain-containing protein